MFKKIEPDKMEKYHEELKKYYSLKKKFDDQKKNQITKILGEKLDSQSKKNLYSKIKFKCANCGKPGGTLFKQTPDKLIATCGSDSPCNLDINIERLKFDNCIDIYEKNNKELNEKRNEVIKAKLDFLFNYKTEEETVSIFENLKEDLNNVQQQNINLFHIIEEAKGDSKEKIQFLKEKEKDLYEKIQNYKDIIKIYKTTGESKYLKDAIELYNTSIKKNAQDLMKLKYKTTHIEKDEDGVNIFYQKRYNIQDLEVPV